MVEDKDHGYKALVDRVFKFGRPTIAVGVLAGQGAEKPHGKDETGEMLSTLQVAIFNEFGTYTKDGRVHVPERSFIRGWWDEQESNLRRDLIVLMRLVVAGKLTKEEVLQKMAVRCVGQIQERIAAGLPPPNAPSTVRAKGGGATTPLIDTGQLRAAVTSRITQG